MRKIVYLPATILTAYLVISPILVWSINFNPPNWLETIISISIAPAFFLVYPFFPLLEKMGLLASGYWTLPTIPGYIVIILIYDLILIAVGLAISKFIRKTTITT